MTPPLSAKQAREQSEHSLFSGKSWKWSPQAWPLPVALSQKIRDLAAAAIPFYRAIDLLYRKSWSDKSILRNEESSAPWVADYFDGGKPDWLVRHGRSHAVRSSMPAVFRPDLIPHRGGLALTEWDAVPGGIGLTANLSRLYQTEKQPGMVESFGEALRRAAERFGGKAAHMVIAVSEEAGTYLPEMDWLCERLREMGYSIRTCNPNDLKREGEGLFLGGLRIHLVYRFWELFDFEEVVVMRDLADLVESGNLVVTPPMKHTQEEKLSLALFHHHRLQPFWEENLSHGQLRTLRESIPSSWILEPCQVPPGAFLDGPEARGRKLTDWTDLAMANKRERSLVIKASGFHQSAWGARSVVIGEDLSGEDWKTALQKALDSFPEPVQIVQRYEKPSRFKHPLFSDQGEEVMESGRVRLSPYFFNTGPEAEWSGALATFCPSDKKIIHGMKDGALMPCLAV